MTGGGHQRQQDARVRSKKWILGRIFTEKLAAADLELRELAARAGELEASIDSVLSQLLSL